MKLARESLQTQRIMAVMMMLIAVQHLEAATRMELQQDKVASLLNLIVINNDRMSHCYHLLGNF